MATQPEAAPRAPSYDVLALQYVKDYLRVVDNAEDEKIEGMIPRARFWVEEHTGVAIIQREFVELHSPQAGVVRLYRAPLISVGACGYVDAEANDQNFEPTAYPPSTKLTGDWPSTDQGGPFEVTYTAGLWVQPVDGSTPGPPPDVPPPEIDPRLIGAMLALIDGEYTAGFAYPDDAITAATNCLFYMKFVAP
jgi:hypothetical protein